MRAKESLFAVVIAVCVLCAPRVVSPSSGDASHSPARSHANSGARLPNEVVPLPGRLSETGLFVAGSTTEVRHAVHSFAPQYPLWSDGATKRRWISLPPGTAIDASDAGAWEFPIGTRLWKEFSAGRRVETRLIERVADGSWRFATYIWNEDGTDAVLAPSRGVRALPVASAPGGNYRIPSQADCRACHEGSRAPVLGVSALQLSPDRDPLAPRAELPGPDALDLPALVARGLLRNLPPAALERPPRIAARSPLERAALGYLHANCGHCHDEPREAGASVPVALQLHQGSGTNAADARRVLESMLDAAASYEMPGRRDLAALVVRGNAEASVLVARMRSRNSATQMPPLGTAIPDTEGLALITRWINHYLATRKEGKQ